MASNYEECTECKGVLGHTRLCSQGFHSVEIAESDKCDLCRNTRVSPGSEYGGPWDKHPAAIQQGNALECPWCRAVRLKYGSYFYPVSK